MSSTPSCTVSIKALSPFQPELYQRAWCSVPHPSLPLIATAHAKSVTVFSLATLSRHSALTGGHARSVRSVAWRPDLRPHKLCLATGSFDATAGLWWWDDGAAPTRRQITATGTDDDDNHTSIRDGDDDWQFNLVLEGQEHEIKCVAYSAGGNLLATCSRDRSVWVWEDVGADAGEDEWETVAVLTEHDGDVKAVAWCPDLPGRTAGAAGRYGVEVLASASYDNTARVWREDAEGEWTCVALLDGHAATVWGLEWESRPRGDAYPRLMTFSADGTIRIWTLHTEEDDAVGQPTSGRWPFGSGRIPSTVRRQVRDDWRCTAVLPKVHSRDIYSATWSATTGLVASTGSDGLVVVYGEDERLSTCEKDDKAQASLANGQASSNGWCVLATVQAAHGPYEINHVTWCKRYDAGTERKGVEEMLVTTGDDGIVRPWEVTIS